MRVKETPLSDIRPYPGNPRVNDGAVEAVAASIREFGFQQPIVCDADGTIIAGHTRYKAARALGMETVPVVYAADLTPEQCAAYRLADNRVGELAEWDSELLAQELDGLAGFDMEQFGFDDSDLQMPEAFEEPVSLDEVREVEPDDSAPDRVRLGELWRMGDHVLLCGDATNSEDVKRLIEAGGRSADMLLTDPPYNVDVTGCTADELKIQNDSFDDEADFKRFLLRAFNAARSHLKEGAAALLKLRTRMDLEQREELFSKDPDEMIPAERDYIAAYKKEPQLVPNYQVKWNSILQEETLGEILPDLALGKMTPEEFVEKEDESISRFLEEL